MLIDLVRNETLQVDAGLSEEARDGAGSLGGRIVDVEAVCVPSGLLGRRDEWTDQCKSQRRLPSSSIGRRRESQASKSSRCICRSRQAASQLRSASSTPPGALTHPYSSN
jgi:hypothetical protein